MSLAGVRSNRGDAYQTLVALDWAILMINDPTLAALEVDSTVLGAGGVPIQVDDVVVHFAHGKKTYCQCKKNETHFDAWTVATLGSELAKAALLLDANANCGAAFYSASPFGELQVRSMTHHSWAAGGSQMHHADTLLVDGVAYRSSAERACSSLRNSPGGT